MDEKDVIIVQLPKEKIQDIVKNSVKYAIISLPFTVNRMSIPNEKQRILNIAKGKIAEGIFQEFCNENDLKIDFETCTTQFWTIDKRDFLFLGGEWDIKNNFYYAEKGDVKFKYTDLPALIPNRFPGDQWGKRNQLEINSSKFLGFLFTYLRMSELNKGKRGKPFLEINLSNKQEKFLIEQYEQYEGSMQAKEPFTTQWFWEEMKEKGSENYFTLNTQPELIITGCANRNHWNNFKDVGRGDRENHFQKYLEPRWYIKENTGSCNFMQGTLWATIKNSTIPISKLPSFLSLVPELKNSVKYGKIIGNEI